MKNLTFRLIPRDASVLKLSSSGKVLKSACLTAAESNISQVFHPGRIYKGSAALAGFSEIT